MDVIRKHARDIAPGPMLAFVLVTCGAGIWVVTTFAPLLRMN